MKKITATDSASYVGSPNLFNAMNRFGAKAEVAEFRADATLSHKELNWQSKNPKGFKG